MVNAGIDDGLIAAGAGGLDLAYLVGEFEEAFGAREEVGLEVGTQAVASDVNAEFIDDIGELVNLLRGEELCLIDEDLLEAAGGMEFANEFEDIRIGLDEDTLAAEAAAGRDGRFVITVINGGLHREERYTAFLKTVSVSDEHHTLARVHGGVNEFETRFHKLQSIREPSSWRRCMPLPSQ